MTETKLTGKQKRFAEEYVVDLNATAAYRRAGYSGEGNAAEVNASKLLRNYKVAAYIETLQQTRSQRTQITADRVLQEIAKIAFANVTDVADFDKENGVVFRDSRELSANAKAAIAEVASEKETRLVGKGENAEPVTTVKLKFKMHNKMEALKQLMAYLGLTSDFNTAVMTLRKYGLALKQCEDTESGWEVVKADDSTSTTA